MRLLYLSASLIPSRSANSIHVMKMCQAFRRLGHEVHLVARPGPESGAEPFAFYGIESDFPITFLRWPRHRLGGVVYGQLASRFLSASRSTVEMVYGRSLHSVFHSVRKGIPSVLELHAPPSGRLRHLVEKLIFRGSSLRRIVVISEALKQAYLDLFPEVSSERILVAPDGADPWEPGQTVGSWPGRDRRLQIGYVGHLYAGKGVEIVAEISKRLPEMDFHVVGGNRDDVATWEKATLSRNFHLHGFVPHSRVGAYLARFDVLLLPNQRKVEAFGGGGDIGRWTSPLKMFEYMSTGRSIVASNLPVLKEVLRHGENCLLADPGNVEEWVSNLKRLEATPELGRLLGEQARRDFLEKYQWKRRAQNVLAGL